MGVQQVGRRRARQGPRRRAPRPAHASRLGRAGQIQGARRGAAAPRGSVTSARRGPCSAARPPGWRRRSPQGRHRRPPQQAGAHRYLLRARIFLRLRLRRRMRFFRHLARIFCRPGTDIGKAGDRHVNIAPQTKQVVVRGGEMRGIWSIACAWAPHKHESHPSIAVAAPCGCAVRRCGRTVMGGGGSIASLAHPPAASSLNPAPSTAPTTRATRAPPAHPPRCTPVAAIERYREDGRWCSRNRSANVPQRPVESTFDGEMSLRVIVTSRHAPHRVTSQRRGGPTWPSSSYVADDMTIALRTFGVHPGHFGGILEVKLLESETSLRSSLQNRRSNFGVHL